jgi:hypothetical protein
MRIQEKFSKTIISGLLEALTAIITAKKQVAGKRRGFSRD